jgi:hypothetical protein
MLNKLHFDIIYKLTEFLTLKEIYIIKNLDKKLNNIIRSLEKIIVKNNLELYNLELHNNNNNNNNNDLYTFYNFIQINMNNFYNQKLTIISDNTFINNLYKKIIMYCLENKCNIIKYPSLFDLFIFFIYLNIDIYNNINNNYIINFLNLSKPKKYIYNDIFYDIKIKYYSCIISYIHNKLITVDYDILIDMSKYISSLCVLRKIFTYKQLDLKYTKLYQCCHYCAFENLQLVCNIKKLYYTDALISENYNKLKIFLKRKNIYYYKYLLDKETLLVNDMIYIKNPINNRRMKINGIFYKKKMLEIYTLDYNIYKDINSYIKKKQLFLKKKFFT